MRVISANVGLPPSDSVFTRENGNRVQDFRETWAKACNAAGVPALLFHTCAGQPPAISEEQESQKA